VAADAQAADLGAVAGVRAAAEVETKLVEGTSHQVPLNPEVKTKLPKEMKTPRQVKIMDVDWEKAADMWDEAQKFLAQHFTQ
jgi:iron(III) transport system substrate-binding protein